MTPAFPGCSTLFECSTSDRSFRHRSRPPRIQGDRVEKRRKRQDAVRENLRRFRERQRSGFDGSVARSTELFHGFPSPYISNHQQRSIYDFLDRIYSINSCPGTCSTCSESYHGIRLKGSQCERCFNEVDFIFVRLFHAYFYYCSAQDIALWKKTTQIQEVFQMLFVVFLKGLPKWRRCFAALLRHVS